MVVMAQEDIFPIVTGHIITLVVILTMKVVEEEEEEDRDAMQGLIQREVLNDSKALLIWSILTPVAVEPLVSSTPVAS